MNQLFPSTVPTVAAVLTDAATAATTAGERTGRLCSFYRVAPAERAQTRR